MLAKASKKKEKGFCPSYPTWAWLKRLVGLLLEFTVRKYG
jgi:hypothetical protein